MEFRRCLVWKEEESRGRREGRWSGGVGRGVPMEEGIWWVEERDWDWGLGLEFGGAWTCACFV